MNKIIIIISCLFTALFSQAQISYTPQTAAGYQFKYLKADSGFAVTYRDTTIGRGTARPGSIVCRPQDSLFYGYNGLKWVKLGNDAIGVINKVDSVTITAGVLYYWINGASTGVTLPVGFTTDLQGVTDLGNTTTNNIEAENIRANNGLISWQKTNLDYVLETKSEGATLGTFFRSQLKADSLSHDSLKWYLPDTSGVFITSVNGYLPNKKGQIILPSTGSGADSSIYSTNYRLDSTRANIYGQINTTNAQVTANTTAITQRVTYTNLRDSLNQISLSKNGTNDSTILYVNGRRFAAIDNSGGGGGGGVTTVLPIGSTPNSGGSTISGTDLTLQPADSTYGGIISTLAQKIRGAKTFTDSVSINDNKLFINSRAGTRPTMIEMSRNYLGNIVGKGQFGLLGGGTNHAELNLSLGMDYSDGTHKYFDTTKPAFWSYMYSLPAGAGTSFGLQWVKEGHPNNNIYSLFGKDVFRVDILPNTGTGEAVQGGSRILAQQLRLIDGNYNPSISADLKLTGQFFELTGATEVGLPALRISKGGSANFVSDAIATYKTTGGMNKFHYLNDDNADNYHYNVYEKYQGGTNRDLGGAGKFYVRNWASGGMIDWGIRSQAGYFGGSNSKLDYYFATLDGDFVTRDKMVLSYDGVLTINNLATGYVKSTSGLLSSSAAIPTTDLSGTITNAQLANTAVANLSGTNTGDNAVNSLYSGLVSNATHTGDATGSTALTLATVNSNVGTFGNSTTIPIVTVNAKGLVTAVTTATVSGGGGGLNYSQVKSISNK